MTKKLLSLSLVLVLTMLVVTGCGKQDEVVEDVEVNQEEIDLTGASTFMIDTDQSVIGWEGEMIIIEKKHNGTVMIKEGNLMVRDGLVIAGDIIVDMTTIVNEDLEGEEKTELENHLMSDDFFAVETYSNSTFKITGVEVAVDGEANQYTVLADLTIKDKTNDVSFPAIITINEENELTLTADLAIDRTLWDVRWGSEKFFDDLGDEILSDELKFNIELTANLVVEEEVEEEVVEEENVEEVVEDVVEEDVEEQE